MPTMNKKFLHHQQPAVLYGTTTNISLMIGTQIIIQKDSSHTARTVDSSSVSSTRNLRKERMFFQPGTRAPVTKTTSGLSNKSGLVHKEIL
jgi:hypothetical protein